MTPPDFTITPLAADRLIPARKATGAAISSGHGVATTSTWANRTGSPDRYQATPALLAVMVVVRMRCCRRAQSAAVALPDDTEPAVRVLAHPADPWGSGHYRVIQPFEALKAAGNAEGVLYATLLDTVEQARIDPDVVVLQRRVTDEELEQ